MEYPLRVGEEEMSEKTIEEKLKTLDKICKNAHKAVDELIDYEPKKKPGDD